MRFKFGILSLIAFNSLNAVGVETAGLSGLQSGPIGDGYVFIPTEQLGEEIRLETTKITGKEKTAGNTLKFTGETLNLNVATGLKATESVSVLIQIDHEKHTIRGKGGNQKLTHKSTASELRVGPNIWIGDLLIGLQGSALLLGEDILSSEDPSLKTEIKTDAVTIPRLRLYTGIRSGSVSAMVRSLLYNHGSATRSTSTTTSTSKRHVKRRTAAESSIDTRIEFDSQFSLAGSVTFIDAERASDDNKNSYFTYGIGGLYSVSTALSLAGGMHYTDPHYKRGPDASVIEDNLGGLHLDLGTRYTWKSSAISFDAGYTLPEPAEYQTDQSRNAVNIERTQWMLALGLKTAL